MLCGNTLLKTAIIFSGIVNRHVNGLPAYLMLITANALPVYGAAIGKLVFFQVIYLYWFESLLLIFFDCIRIGAAQGRQIGGGIFNKMAIGGVRESGEVAGFSAKAGLILRTIIIRVLLLLFYLLFIVAFVGFRITGKEHKMDVMETMIFRNQFFNTAVIIFLINMVVQLIGGFFISGKYHTDSPRTYANFFDGRTMLMHVMIVGSVFIHQFFFEKKSYAATGEIVYVGIFMLIKTIVDILHLRSRFVCQHVLSGYSVGLFIQDNKH